MWKILFPIALLFLGASGYILSKEENDALQKYCGTGMKIPTKYNRKITNGMDTKFDDAPWTAKVLRKEFVNKDTYGYVTGTLISPKHVLSHWHAFVSYNGGRTWNTRFFNRTMSKTRCEGSDYVMDPSFTQYMTIDFDIDGTVYKHKVAKVVILEKCANIDDVNRPMLIELAEPLKNDKIKPICVDFNRKTWSQTKELKFFGWGAITIKGQGHKFLAARIRSAACDLMEEDVVCAKTIGNTSLNWGDHGGSAITKINKQLTLAGLYIDQRFERNGERKDKSYKHTSYKFAHIANYHDKISRLTGIRREGYDIGTTTETGGNTTDTNGKGLGCNLAGRVININIFAGKA